MALLAPDGNPHRPLVEGDYKPTGELKTLDANVALVNGCASAAEKFISNKQ